MLLLCSTYLTVLVSGDRYFLICWPLIAEKIRTRKIALHLVLLVFILVNIYIFPHWFEYRTSVRSLTQSISTQNVTEVDELVELTYTKLGSNAIYLKIYRMYLNVPITFVIPFTLLTLCNGSMIHQLLLIKKKKKRLGHRMKADIRITIMLIVIVLTFMLCRSINLFVNLLVQLSPCLNKNSLHRFNTFANLLTAFNGFINFFLFAAFGQRFREMVLYIFFRHGRHPFETQLDASITHRFNHPAIASTNEPLRRQSRRFSSNESDIWAAISRRRSSASMAALYNPSDNRSRSISHSNTNSSHLHIPVPFKETSNSSINISQAPYSDVSDNVTLTVPNQKNHNSNLAKTKTLDDDTPPTTLHVTFV